MRTCTCVRVPSVATHGRMNETCDMFDCILVCSICGSSVLAEGVQSTAKIFGHSFSFLSNYYTYHCIDDAAMAMPSSPSPLLSWCPPLQQPLCTQCRLWGNYVSWLEIHMKRCMCRPMIWPQDGDNSFLCDVNHKPSPTSRRLPPQRP